MSFGDTSRGFSEWSLGGIDLTLDDFDRIGSPSPRYWLTCSRQAGS
jgi:hypothetical protein